MRGGASVGRVPFCAWDLGAELGEGPVWHDGRLLFVDIKGRRIHRFDPATGEQKSWPTPEPVGFALPAADGALVVGLKSGLHRFRPETGLCSVLTAVEPEELGNRLNDAAVDDAGYLWFGAMHDAETEPSGGLYRLDDDGVCRRRDEGYIVTNGPAFSPDGRTLYHTDTLGQVIYAFDRDGAGSLSGKRIFVRIEERGVYPDGPVVDSEGCVWTGLFGGWGVRRYDPAGALMDEIRLPCSRATKLAFGGPDLTTMFITTAWLGLSPEQRVREPLAGGLFQVAAGVAGRPSMPIRHGVGRRTPTHNDEVIPR